MSEELSKVKAGLFLLGKAIETLPDAMTQCGMAKAQAEKLYALLKSFKSPWSFAYHVGKDLLVNRVQIYKDIENLLAAYQSKNYKQMGYFSGHALSEILIGTTLNALKKDNETANYGLDLTVIEKIFIGVLRGVEVEADLTALEECLKDSSTAGVDFVQAVELFMNKDANSVKAGLKLLGEAIELLPNAMTECKQAVEDAKRLYQMIANFKSPWSFAYHAAKDLLVNGVQIYQDIEAAVQAYKGQDWDSFGYNCGYAMALVLLGGAQPTFDMTDYEAFRNLTNEEFTERYLGLNLVNITNLPRVDYRPLLAINHLPIEFDSRTQWPDCVHEIRNQGQCGSCWAFAGSEALSDRFCIASQGKISQVLSPQFMVSCDTSNWGCKGGILPYEWEFLEDTGTVSDACLTYHSGDGSTFPCYNFQKCEDGSRLRHYFVEKGSSKTFTDHRSLKHDLMTHGPLETGFTVYENFQSYKGGIYTKGDNPGKELGGHAVKIVGWGVENQIHYWIVANSWGVTWGENGFFRIKIGEVGIDSDAIAGLPDLNRQ